MTVARLTPELLHDRPLPAPEEHADKNTRGTVLVVGASATSAGAVTLSGVAAFRAGAGKVLLAVPQLLAVPIAVDFPEAGVHAFADTQHGAPLPAEAAQLVCELLAKADVGLIGPGLMDESAAQELTRRVLDASSGPGFVIDALALTGLWNERRTLARHRGRLVITPHAGEMARLSGQPIQTITADTERVAIDAARHLGCVVVLKGSTTVIASETGEAFVHEGAIAGLATSGSGDVLAGVIAGLMARGASATDAALWGVHLHAGAGRRLAERIGPLGYLARELLIEIPRLMRPPSGG